MASCHRGFFILGSEKGLFRGRTMGKLSGVCAVLLLQMWSVSAVAECRDRDAKAAGDALAKSYFRGNPTIFYPAKVFKRHWPSLHKEVASYVQIGNYKYSIFSLVDLECKARFIKRTRQND